MQKLEILCILLILKTVRPSSLQQTSYPGISNFTIRVTSRPEIDGNWTISTNVTQSVRKSEPTNLLIDIAENTTRFGDMEDVSTTISAHTDSSDEYYQSTSPNSETDTYSGYTTLPYSSDEYYETTSLNSETAAYLTSTTDSYSSDEHYESTSPNSESDTYLKSTTESYGYVKYSGLGYIKVHNNERATWKVANETCVNEGAHLMYVDSDKRAEIFEKLFQETWSDNFQYLIVHVGVYKDRKKENYLTVLGTPVDHTRWDEWQPNIAFHCGASFFDGRTFPYNCSRKFYFFCERPDALQYDTESPFLDYEEKPTTPRDIPSKAPPPADYEEFPGVGFYKLVKSFLSWNDANDTCTREGGHLMIIDSDQKAEVYQILYLRNWPKRDSDGAYIVNHVGFYSPQDDGNFVTVLGDPIDVTRWAYGQPDGDEQLCGAARWNGELHDVKCSMVSSYVCEIIP